MLEPGAGLYSHLLRIQGLGQGVGFRVQGLGTRVVLAREASLVVRNSTTAVFDPSSTTEPMHASPPMVLSFSALNS